MCITTSGYVTSRGVDWDQLLTANQTGRQFRFKFLHAVQLGFGEGLDPGMGKLDILFGLLGQRCPGMFYLLFRHYDITLPAIEIAGIFQNPGLTPRLNLGQHVSD